MLRHLLDNMKRSMNPSPAAPDKDDIPQMCKGRQGYQYHPKQAPAIEREVWRTEATPLDGLQ